MFMYETDDEPDYTDITDPEYWFRIELFYLCAKKDFNM